MNVEKMSLVLRLVNIVNMFLTSIEFPFNNSFLTG